MIHNKYLLRFAVCAISLLLAVESKIMNADDSGTAGTQNKTGSLSGSYYKPEDILSESDIILVGELIKIGMPDTKAAGTNTYHDVQVKVLQILKGSTDPVVSIELSVIQTETPPQVGNHYIFFIKKETIVSGNKENIWLIVRKLLPATDEHIAKVKQLITSITVPK